MARDISGKLLIITGASSGIGAATARAAARAGMNLLLTARRADRLEQVAGEIRQTGVQCEVLPGDVAESDFSTRVLDLAEDKFGGFYAVFANAGYGFHAPVHEMATNDLRRIFEVNFFAAVELLQLAARRLIAAQQRGHLLMCSSAVAKFTLPAFSAYSATKAAQNHVCRAMRLELKPHRIEVASVHPIGTTTEFSDVAAQLTRQAGGGETNTSHTPGWLSQTPERVAHAVIACLRRPRPEVWTSFPARFGAGLVTIFPRLFDLAMVRSGRA